MDFQTIRKLDGEYLAATYARYPVALVGGKNATLVDSEGKQYIDFGAGIAVNIFGANDEQWKAAVIEQLGKIQHVSNYYYAEPQVRLAQMLCERTGAKRVFFSNSGGEANECALKAARKYSFMRYGEDRSRIVSLKNSFHGRTLFTLTATGQDEFHRYFSPFVPEVAYAAPDMEEVVRAADGRACAVIIECVQGESGVSALPKAFVQALSHWCSENDVLLICDEVQCGNGRGGTLYAYEQYGITPDIATTAKGLAGGLPLGATLLGDKVADLFTPGSNGSTFGGNPIAAAGALYVLSGLDDDLLAGVRRKSEQIRAALTGAPGVESVTGLGLMLGVQTTLPAKEVASRCIGRGVLVLTAKDKVRLLPALNIPDDLLMQAIGILKDICAEGVQ
mgnify:CR=1 FL=1